MTDPNGNTCQYAYDSGNRLTSYTDPEEKVTAFAYDFYRTTHPAEQP